MKIVPVKNARYIAHAASFFWWKRVYVGKGFFKLPIPHREAVIAHEMVHLDEHHTELRILCLLLFFPLYGAVCRACEFRADKKSGYVRELVEILKHAFPGNWRYPSHSDRRNRLLALPTLKATLRPIGVTDKEEIWP
jgi:hypothetical protein